MSDATYLSRSLDKSPKTPQVKAECNNLGRRDGIVSLLPSP